MFTQPTPYTEAPAVPGFTVPQPPIHAPAPAVAARPVFEHPPTGEQQAILDAAATGQPLVVEAGAGTGKTSTLKMVAAATPRRALYLAYNKAIADEALASFPANTDCRTAHSLAFRAVGHQYKDRLNGARLPAREVARVLRIPAVVDLGKHALTSVKVARLVMDAVRRFCYSDWETPSDAHVPVVPGLEEPSVHAELCQQVVPLVHAAWADLTAPNGRLKFEHDHYLKLWALTRPTLPADLVFLDEAQDANPVISRIVEAQAAQRILVGDQCQPAGTLVTVVRRYRRGNRFTGVLPTETAEVPIEQIEPGDVVVSYDIPRSFLRRTGSKVTGVTERPYSGPLVEVDADGQTSRYTPDHHCVVRFGDQLADQHVVYLMRRGDDYRIGVTAGRMVSQSKRLGVAIRANQEKADAIWILSAHATRSEATFAESLTAWTYGIPTITFRAGNRSTISQEHLDALWAKLGGNRGAAQKVLAAHGRTIRFPLWEQGESTLQTRRPTIIRACNLLDGMEVLPLSEAMLADGKRASVRRWVPITVNCQKEYSGLVYSMTVEGDHTYVGDGIITHNCQAIYGWRGAVDAMESFDGQRFQLSQSFRFGQAIADEANRWLDLLDAPLRLSGNPAKESKVGVVYPGQAILCRTNAGAIGQAMAALSQNLRPALVGGGDDIRRLARACQDLRSGRGTDHPELMAFASWAEVQEYAEHDSGGQDLKTLVKLVDGHGPEAILRVVDQLVDEHNADIVISTAHRAKGREWDTVRLAADFKEPYNQAGALDRGEAMLTYVAVTRAKDLLDKRALDAAAAGGIGHRVLAEQEELDAEQAELFHSPAGSAAAVHRIGFGPAGAAAGGGESPVVDTLTPDPPRAETDLPADLIGWLDYAKQAADNEKSWKEVKEAAQQKIKDWCVANNIDQPTVAGQPACSYKESAPSGQLDGKALKADHPDIYAAYYKPKKASRPFNFLGRWK